MCRGREWDREWEWNRPREVDIIIRRAMCRGRGRESHREWEWETRKDMESRKDMETRKDIHRDSSRGSKRVGRDTVKERETRWDMDTGRGSEDRTGLGRVVI